MVLMILRFSDSWSCATSAHFRYAYATVHEMREGPSEPACRGKKAGILLDAKDPTGYRFHDIRATTKTFMVDAGVDKALRDTIMGHSLRGMDKHYLRFKDEDLRAGMARYTEWLDKQFADASSLLTKPLTKGV